MGHTVNIDSLMDEAIKTPYYFAIKSVITGIPTDENGCADTLLLMLKAEGKDCYETLRDIIFMLPN